MLNQDLHKMDKNTRNVILFPLFFYIYVGINNVKNFLKDIYL